MSFCDHCQGQRFDRARVLRALRQVQRELRRSRAGAKCEGALAAALNAVRELDLPHLEDEEDDTDNMIVH
jgi:hypothetical protein